MQHISVKFLQKIQKHQSYDKLKQHSLEQDDRNILRKFFYRIFIIFTPKRTRWLPLKFGTHIFLLKIYECLTVFFYKKNLDTNFPSCLIYIEKNFIVILFRFILWKCISFSQAFFKNFPVFPVGVVEIWGLSLNFVGK